MPGNAPYSGGMPSTPWSVSSGNTFTQRPSFSGNRSPSSPSAGRGSVSPAPSGLGGSRPSGSGSFTPTPAWIPSSATPIVLPDRPPIESPWGTPSESSEKIVKNGGLGGINQPVNPRGNGTPARPTPTSPNYGASQPPRVAGPNSFNAAAGFGIGQQVAQADAERQRSARERQAIADSQTPEQREQRANDHLEKYGNSFGGPGGYTYPPGYQNTGGSAEFERLVQDANRYRERNGMPPIGGNGAAGIGRGGIGGGVAGVGGAAGQLGGSANPNWFSPSDPNQPWNAPYNPYNAIDPATGLPWIEKDKMPAMPSYPRPMAPIFQNPDGTPMPMTPDGRPIGPDGVPLWPPGNPNVPPMPFGFRPGTPPGPATWKIVWTISHPDPGAPGAGVYTYSRISEAAPVVTLVDLGPQSSGGPGARMIGLSIDGNVVGSNGSITNGKNFSFSFAGPTIETPGTPGTDPSAIPLDLRQGNPLAPGGSPAGSPVGNPVPSGAPLGGLAPGGQPDGFAAPGLAPGGSPEPFAPGRMPGFSPLAPTNPIAPSAPRPSPSPTPNPQRNPQRDPGPQPTGGTAPSPSPSGNPFGSPSGSSTQFKGGADPSGSPSPTPNPNPAPGGGSGTGTGTGNPPQPPNCRYPTISSVSVDIFDGFDDAGEPKKKSQSIACLPDAVERVRASFAQLYEILSKKPLKSEAIAIPEAWAVRRGTQRPQLVIVYAEIFGSGKLGSSRWSLTVPHYRGTAKSKISAPSYKRGNWQGQLTLNDGSTIVVNAASSEECKRSINKLKILVPNDYRLTKDGKAIKPRVVENPNIDLKSCNVVPVMAKFYATGQKDMAPTWSQSLRK
jgi:hypothetical protein